MDYVDEANGITAWVKMDAYKFKSQDFFKGEILKDGKKICTIEGNYMGYIDFDKIRYWDLRDEEQFPKHFKPEHPDPDALPSDSSHRGDRLLLCEFDYEAA